MSRTAVREVLFYLGAALAAAAFWWAVYYAILNSQPWGAR
jgi:hypothetical protein